MRFLSLFLFSLIFPSIANAEQTTQEALCQYFNGRQEVSSGAEYVPGVDVHGNDVLGANVSDSGSSFLNDPIVIPVNVDLAQRFGLPLPNGINLEPTLSQIKIHADGHVSYNDQNVTQKVKAGCEVKPPVSTLKAEEGDGQDASDTVPSSGIIKGQYPEN